MIDSTALVIAAAGAVLAGLGYLIKKYIESLIAHELAKHKEVYVAELRELGRIREQLLDARLRAHRELSTLIYKCRNSSRGLLTAESELAHRDLGTAIHDLETLMYSVRFDLDETLFDNVHAYKVLLIEFQAIRATTNPQAVKSVSPSQTISPVADDPVDHCAKIEVACNDLLTALKIQLPNRAS